AILGDDGVLRPYRRRAGHQLGHLGDRTKTFVVAISPLLPRRDLRRKQPKLLQQNGGLDRVEPAVETEIFGIGAAWPFAVVPQGAQPRGFVIVIGKQGTPVAIAPERLRRVEAGRRVGPERADLLAVEARTEALRRIGNNHETMRRGDFVYSSVIRRLAIEIDGNNAAWLEPAPLGFADGGFEALHVE